MALSLLVQIEKEIGLLQKGLEDVELIDVSLSTI